MSIRQIYESELPTVAEMAHEIWLEHYPAIIGEKQTRFMLERMYSLDSLLEQMHEKKHRFYFWEKGESPIGFASLETENEQGAFLAKFYLKKEFRRTGEAAKFLNQLEKEAAASGKQKMWLTVNRQNIGAINFYFKHGFKITRCEDFDIGKGFFMNDFIMEKQKIGQ